MNVDSDNFASDEHLALVHISQRGLEGNTVTGKMREALTTDQWRLVAKIRGGAAPENLFRNCRPCH
jgi:hypothetical protein